MFTTDIFPGTFKLKIVLSTFLRSLDVSNQKDFSKNLKQLQTNTKKVHETIGRKRHKYLMSAPTEKQKNYCILYSQRSQFRIIVNNITIRKGTG